MNKFNINEWNNVFQNIVLKEMKFDSAHDIAHIKRVVKNGLEIANYEQADISIILPACWLHDIVNVDKKSDLRNKGSLLSADKAIQILKDINYKSDYEKIHHAIHAHSFSANVKTNNIEAMVVQDADRLDALGALGISRCLMYGAHINTPLYDFEDPFAENRELDDSKNTIDHFHIKLKKLPDTMKTEKGKIIAKERWLYMEDFLNQLKKEIQ